jgi:hypothetical protein
MIPAYLDVADPVLPVQLKDDEMFAIEYTSCRMDVGKSIGVTCLQ